MQKIKIQPPFIKLDSLLKLASISSTGGQMKQFISSGGILVNGNVVIQRGKKIFPGDVVRVLTQPPIELQAVLSSQSDNK
ncbi:MAG: RNA-binding protein [Candidatus Marinimicrobia bacterium CG08_land_8_20_14_0_20_45_22]|nr:MAG: RNA-binding protein [Candidatus Marinimicrobia bacterium CG08_land_8_20_14_0_20_45_22]